MSLFELFSLLGGVGLFLYGMTIMSTGLKKTPAGKNLRVILEHATKNKVISVVVGIAITMLIQSSSATTVMVVGFVNSGLLTLRQAISVIMGANVGTTVTAWILSLTGLDGDNFFVMLLKPTSFTPILALIGVVLTMMAKSDKKKDVGMILLALPC